ncbi:hypothetical protein AVEN_272816-1 [Araneus ventricosus]|uniref:Uncharacterized protein n=1 Tax=Araneus ventricosus TaxID=182803 RepID=A0A4Y2SZY4_ARAVE|nr:hypothetical protein AVEN_272816-1 [Araneus ventricosus]
MRNEAETIASGEIDFTFTPHFNQKFHVKTSAFLIEKITDNIPTINLPQSLKDSFSDLLLADPNFHNASETDVLLGVNVFLSLMKGETIKRDEGLPFALSTKLGWVITGSTAFPVENLETLVSYLSVNTEELIQSFWELEQIPTSSSFTKEENLCE